MNNQNVVNLSVKDFQIIKNANLSFLPGLNCIIGQSNNGKSALMRAAKACIYNESGTTSVRLGCSNFAVGIQMNGHTVILQKGANSLYKVDNQVYGKIGRTQLEEVANALGIRDLNINGSNEEINFWDQMEKPFLLDRTETELFRFIVDSGKDNNVTTALKTITQDRQQISKDITLTEGKFALLDDTLARQEEELKDADKKITIYNRVIELGPKIKRVQTITDLKNKVIQDGQQLSNCFNLKNKLDTLLTSIYDRLNIIINSSSKLDSVNKLVTDISSTSSIISELNNRLSKISHLEVPNLSEKFNKYKLLSELISSASDTSNQILELSSRKFPEISINLSEKMIQLNKISDLISSINNKKLQIETLTNNKFPEVSVDLSEKMAQLDKISDLISSINNKKSQIETLTINKKDIEDTIVEINNEINKIGVCPFCGQPIHNN